MRTLVVTADDLGADGERTRGILEALRAGALTSVSVLANGPALEEALAGLRPLAAGAVSVGLHVNLSQGSPVAAGHRRLVGADGRLLGKAAAHRLLLRRRDDDLAAEVAREVAAQAARLLDAGVELDHLDGHQHVHLFPAVVAAAAATAQRLGLRWVRVPDEPPDPPPAASAAPDAREAACFARLARWAAPRFARAGLARATRFYGLRLKGRLTSEGLARLAASMPEGVTELMVHPGRAPADGGAASRAAGFTFGGVEREEELRALLEPSWRVALARAGVVLARFPRLAPVGGCAPCGSCS